MQKQLKNFVKWLENHNIKYSIVNYGESHYFYNAPGFVYEAIAIDIEADTITAVNNQANKIKKYISRCNLDIINNPTLRAYCTGNYNYHLRVRTAADKAASENYYYFRDKSIEECEKLMHEYHESGKYNSHHAELNNKMREIMDKYGSLYNKSLIKEVKAA